MEQWAQIAGYEGYYSVSNTGKVRSEARIVGKKNMSVKERLMKFGSDRKENGYCKVYLTINRVTKSFLVHRLVYASFMGVIPEGVQIDHIDGNKENNNLSNLRLATAKENRVYALERKYNTTMVPGYTTTDNGRAIHMSRAYVSGYEAGYAQALKDHGIS